MHITIQEQTPPFDLQKKKAWVAYVMVSLCLLGSYYYTTIPASSVNLDQYLMVQYSSEMLDGKFRWVGMRTSRLNWNFPMIHYVLTPLIAFTESIQNLNILTAIGYLLGIWIIAWMLLHYRNFSEFICFALFSLTHVWTLFYSSFMWPPNYLPLISSLFLICFVQYLRNSKKVVYFYGASFFLNVAVQTHSLSSGLILGFVLGLIVLGKLPRYRHWFFQILIQIFLISPWLIFHTFILDWSKEPSYHSALFKNFPSPFEELFNYLSGVGLIREYTMYLAYGTNTFPYENFFESLLNIGGVILMFLLCWTLWKQHSFLKAKKFHWKQAFYYLQPYYQEEKNFQNAYPIMLYLLFLPTFIFLFSGMGMFAHYFQFLSPLLFLLIALLPGQLRNPNMRNLALLCIAGVVMIQGSFSYWRAIEEYRNPYLHDVGYTPALARSVASQCKDKPEINFLSRYGWRNSGGIFSERYEPEYKKAQKTGSLNCGSLLVFQNKLMQQSPVVQWHIQQLQPIKKLELHNNQIWIMGQQ